MTTRGFPAPSGDRLSIIRSDVAGMAIVCAFVETHLPVQREPTFPQAAPSSRKREDTGALRTQIILSELSSHFWEGTRCQPRVGSSDAAYNSGQATKFCGHILYLSTSNNLQGDSRPRLHLSQFRAQVIDVFE